MFSKSNSNIKISKIVSSTDTESIESMLDTIETRLNDDVFNDVMKILKIQDTHEKQGNQEKVQVIPHTKKQSNIFSNQNQYGKSATTAPKNRYKDKSKN